MMEGGTKIADAFNECQKLFANLTSGFHSHFGREAPSDLRYDQPGRLNLWAGNIGAHQRGRRSSLDYRLRNVPHLAEAVLGCLLDIENALQDATHSLFDTQTASDWSSDEDECSDDEIFQPTTVSGSTNDQLVDLAFMIKHIDHLIDCLFDLSITIRNPATRGLRPSKYSSIDVSAYWSYELEHVRQKLLSLPRADDSAPHYLPSQPLIERLAAANLERRQYLMYQTQHHEKLEAQENVSELRSQTTATEYVEKGAFGGDYASSYAPSEVSCVSVGDGKVQLAFPPLPKESTDHKYFECPYCYELLALTTTLEWRKHILLDLRPYLCVFDNCSQNKTLFSTRKEWFNHELDCHWNYWSCSDCQQTLTSLSIFEEHMRRAHSISVAEYHRQNLAKACRRKKSESSSVSCDICGAVTTLKDRVRHVGRHMEGIALFALGTWEQGEYEYEDEVGEDDEELGELKDEEGDLGIVNTDEDQSEVNSIVNDANQGNIQPIEATGDTNRKGNKPGSKKNSAREIERREGRCRRCNTYTDKPNPLHDDANSSSSRQKTKVCYVCSAKGRNNEA